MGWSGTEGVTGTEVAVYPSALLTARPPAEAPQHRPAETPTGPPTGPPVAIPAAGGRAARAARLLRPLAGIAVIGGAGWRLGAGPFRTAVTGLAVPTLAGALALGALTTLLCSWRWSLVSGALGLPLSLRAAVRAYYRALFLNAVLPGGVLGDVHRAGQHGRDAGDVRRAATAVVLERTAGQLVLALAGGPVLLAVLPPLPRAVGSAALAAGALGLVARRVRAPRASGAQARARGTAARPSRWIADARRGLLTPGVRGRVATASALVLAGHVATFALAAAAVHASLAPAPLAGFALLALIAMTLPLSVGGWGPREAVTAWAFAAAGLSAAQGLAVALTYGLLALTASLPGALVLVADLSVRHRRSGTGWRRRES